MRVWLRGAIMAGRRQRVGPRRLTGWCRRFRWLDEGDRPGLFNGATIVHQKRAIGLFSLLILPAFG
jgi:hypothetical protein